MPWRTWSNMKEVTDLPEWSDRTASNEDFEAAARSFYRILRSRIVWLKDRLKFFPTDELAEAHYVLAGLHDRLDMDDRRQTLRRGVRYHAIKALRLNKNHAAASALLGFAFNMTGLMSQMLRRHPGEDPVPDEEREVVFFGRATGRMYLRRGVRYLERATQLAPDNETYSRWLSTARRELASREADSQDSQERRS